MQEDLEKNIEDQADKEKKLKEIKADLEKFEGIHKETRSKQWSPGLIKM